MANAEVKVVVDSSQLDKTVVKLGELKDLGKGLKIQFDIDGRPIDIVIDKSMNLQKQVKILTAELRRTKEGTAEFALLSSKLGDAQDQLAKTTAKSKDLFSSLSLLPGPVGQFFGQLNGAIGLLKTFSSFSLKDLKFQLGETVGDIKDIKDGFAGVSDSVKNTTNATDESINVFREQGDTIASVIDESKAIVDQFDLQQKAVKNISDLTSKGALVNEIYTTGLVKSADGSELVAGVINKQTNATRVLSEAELQLVATGKGVILTTEGMVVAEGAATVATYSLAGAVKALGVALGIGGLLIILTFLIDKLIEGGKYLISLVTGTLAAEEATKKLGKSLDDLEVSFEKSNKAIKRSTTERIALMKAQGATEEEIRKATIDGMLKERDQTSKTLGETVEVIKKLQANRGKNDEENNKQIERAVKKKRELEEQYKDQSSAIRVSELNNITENNKKIAENNKKALDDGNKLLEKRNADRKTADETYRQLLQENSVLSLKTERERQFKELENQSINEKLKIDALDISEKRKEEIKLQITTKYGVKSTELKTKFNEEDLKKEKEYSEKVEEAKKKLGDIEIAAIQNQTIKEKQERENKYNEELKDVKKLYDDKLISLTEYQMAVINLNQGLVNDLKKIDDDAKEREKQDNLKKLDDDIKFQEISNEANKNNFQEYYKGRQTLLDLSKQRELLEVEAGSEKALLIEKKYASLSKQVQQEKYQAILGFVSQGLSAASNVISQSQQVSQLAMQNELDAVKGSAEEQDKIKAKYFEKNKKTQIAQAIISTLQSAISAFSSLAVIPVVGPALGAAAAAAALIFGYKQVDQIKKQQYQSSTGAGDSAEAAKPAMANYGRSYESGGLIGGRRHAQGGTMIEAEKGEAIMTRGAVTMFAPLLSTLNQMGGGTSFAPSLMTTSYDKPIVTQPSQEQSPIIVKSYVVSSDMTSAQEKNARLKDLSTL